MTLLVVDSCSGPNAAVAALELGRQSWLATSPARQDEIDGRSSFSFFASLGRLLPGGRTDGGVGLARIRAMRARAQSMRWQNDELDVWPWCRRRFRPQRRTSRLRQPGCRDQCLIPTPRVRLLHGNPRRKACNNRTLGDHSAAPHLRRPGNEKRCARAIVAESRTVPHVLLGQASARNVGQQVGHQHRR